MRLANAAIAAMVGVSVIWMGCTESQTPERVTIGYLPIIAHLPALIATEQGYFGDMEMEFRVFATSNDLLSALSRGEIDATTTVAVAPVAALATVTQDRLPVRIFSYSRTTAAEPFDGVFVRDGSPIKTLAEIKSQRIGVFPGSTAKNILGFLLQRDFAVRVDKVNWVSLPPNLQVDSLAAGDIDILYAYEPTRTVAAASGMRSVYGSVIAGVLEGAPYGASAINKDFERRRPGDAQRLIDALDKGVLFIRRQPGDSRSILRRELGLAPEVAEEASLEYRFTSLEAIDSTNLARFNQFLALLVEMSEIPSIVKAEALVSQGER